MADAAPAIEWDDAEFESVIGRLAAGGTIDASGVRISAGRLVRILEVMPEDPIRPGRRLLKNANFVGATFGGAARFTEATLEGGPGFNGATFEGEAGFNGATFKGEASFRKAAFKDDAGFDGATFKGRARFSEATFDAVAWFGGSTFGADAGFERATFKGFTFGRTGAFSVRGTLGLAGARFERPVELVAAAEFVDCVGATFEAGGNWKLRWAEIDFRRTIFRQLLIVGSGYVAGGDDPKLKQLCTGGAEAENRKVRKDECKRRSSREARPRLLALDGTNVEHLVLSEVDLRACLFGGGHKLDQLRFEDCTFPRTPGWTGREALAEEHRWRSERGSKRLRRRWYHDENRPRYGADIPAPEPRQIATVYRALRKGREDTKDEPGGADLYYGEMEMRRHFQGEGGVGRRLASWWERRTIWLYWLVSGYGLRPSRAVVALLITIAVFGVGFWLIGIDCSAPRGGALPGKQECQETFGRGLLLSAESSSSLFRAPNSTRYILGDPGEIMQLTIRLLGPLFFGLALLSLRGRVKR